MEKNGEADIIHATSFIGDISIVSDLLDNGADPNLAMHDGKTPLMIASLKGHHDVVQLLLERNVAINIQDKNGCTVYSNLSCLPEWSFIYCLYHT